MAAERKWAVTVVVDGESIISISSDDLCGLPNATDYRAEILTAANNLIAFIGREPEAASNPDDKLPW